MLWQSDAWWRFGSRELTQERGDSSDNFKIKATINDTKVKFAQQKVEL